MKVKQKLGVTFNFDKQDFIDFTKNDNVQGLRSKFIKVVLDPLFLGKKIIKGCFLSVSWRKFNSQIEFGKMLFFDDTNF